MKTMTGIKMCVTLVSNQLNEIYTYILLINTNIILLNTYIESEQLKYITY